MHLDVHGLELVDGAVDDVALHREQADLRFECHAVNHFAGVERLKVPDHFLERKGDLLFGLELDDLRDLLLIDGRELDEAARPFWPETLMAMRSPRIALRERNCVRASWVSSSGSASGWLRIFGCSMYSNAVATYLPLFHFQADRLESALPQIDPPDTEWTRCHVAFSVAMYQAVGRPANLPATCTINLLSTLSLPGIDCQLPIHFAPKTTG